MTLDWFNSLALLLPEK
uniref:Uncharacterized protein n=1 Tax=Rhizophora mucronata TaxID=61149 RepID=A0A2P2PMK6_RHIMU